MVEPSEVLIFPKVRISELEEQARVARERFHNQKERTLGSTHEFFRPTNLIKNHKGSLVAGTVSFLLLAKLFTGLTKVVAPKIKGSALFGLMEAGWMWKAMQLSYKLYKFVSEK